MVLFVELDKGEEGGACRSLPAKLSLCPSPSMKASSERDSQVMGKPLSEIPCAVLSSLPVSPPSPRPPGARRSWSSQCSLAFTLNLGMEGVRGSQMGKASPVGHGEQIRFHRTQPGWSGKRRGLLLMAGVHFLAQSCLCFSQGTGGVWVT